jgi:hypothetical protein
MTREELVAVLKEAFENGEWATSYDEGITAEKPPWYIDSHETYFEAWLKYVHLGLVDP